MQVYSEVNAARAREVLADVATAAWLSLWLSLGLRLYEFIAQGAAAGRAIRDGGNRLADAGAQVGGAISGVPLVGEDLAVGVRGGFDAAAEPFISVGTDLERLVLVLAALVGLLVVAVFVIPWLNRYVPWRIARWRRLNAGVRAIRRRRVRGGPAVGAADVERLLASRALHRLEYDELLEFTPDPFGDWLSGRHDRLAQAELDRVGLRTVGAVR
jgi:hypothetical protein